MQSLDQKVAIISGGATLIGAAIAREFIESGGFAVIADIDEMAGVQLARELGQRCAFVATDLIDDTQVRACVAQTLQRFGRIDFLVNVACTYVDNGLASTREEWRRGFDVNVTGSIMLLRAAHASMVKSGGGAVVNFGSVSAHVAQAGRWIYPTTKAAILQLTRSQALDLAVDNIRVNAVSPGWTWSGVLDKVSGGNRNKTDEVAAPFHMLGRVGDPRDVANAVLFLCSDRAAFITGTNLAVDGGYSAMGPEQSLKPIIELQQ